MKEIVNGKIALVIRFVNDRENVDADENDWGDW